MRPRIELDEQITPDGVTFRAVLKGRAERVQVPRDVIEDSIGRPISDAAVREIIRRNRTSIARHLDASAKAGVARQFALESYGWADAYLATG